MDLDRRHTIRETSHRILNPFTPEKLATLGDALFLPPGARVLDLASGKGELLCTWARYAAAQWRNVRAWLDANPGDELAAEVRDELDSAPLRYVTWRRPYLGWGVLALRRRPGRRIP